ncbi:tRNA(Ile)-lysidine synthetase [Mesorhizobium sp. Root554]|uniref:tRNA lysidine(34) synthetase TilS n=1 Tax=unclassified Mesorhizobium TaxID=325217 RepID=UPI0006FA50B7|nr:MULTISPECIES: tRNA lysidine(34) synthetase TilS [unclassified Mesorhizobium]KQZ14672.1 tRNA(Ile)-lysidine synthetase [Mesorhizobium sp. Root1471]KQZ37179.1 tRNA(Ile)-lysidine synthetase [Mesorhizobium sp. Root554]
MSVRTDFEAQDDTSALRALFQTIDFTGGAVVAISGGSDSTALLLLLKRYLASLSRTPKLLAVTVDHALRADSAAEANAVARLSAEHGIAHRIMMWSGPKPASGLAAAARDARYRLLAQAAREAGLGSILTGHTADDQAETVLMRQARGDGRPDTGRGLAGMAPAALYDGNVWILRPFLDVRRHWLRERLRAMQIGWIDDPSNEDLRFERPRVRSRLEGNDNAVVQALDQAAQAGRERVDLGHRAAHLIESHASHPTPGLLRLDPAFAADNDDAVVYALRILLATVGGSPFLPDGARVAALLHRLRAGPLRATLSRSVIDSRRAGIFIFREARSLPAPVTAAGAMLWDGRRHITFGNADDGFLIAPLGVAAGAFPDCEKCDGIPASLVRKANQAEPAVWHENLCLGPVFAGVSDVVAWPIAAPWARLLPAFDLAPASAVAALIGAPSVPHPPFSGHIASGSSSKA